MAISTILVVSLFAAFCGPVVIAETSDFSKERQTSAILATVRIRNAAANREGSGAFIGERGEFAYFLTAQHVVQGRERIEVEVFAQESYPRPKKMYHGAEVIAEMRGISDLALIRLRTSDRLPVALRICPVAKIPKGSPETLLTVGCDVGGPPNARVEKGVEKKKAAQRDDGSKQGVFWEVQAKYAPGRSGGPLVDEQGYLLGICSGTNRDKTYFTHVEEVHGFLIRHGFRWLIEETAEK